MVGFGSDNEHYGLLRCDTRYSGRSVADYSRMLVCNVSEYMLEHLRRQQYFSTFQYIYLTYRLISHTHFALCT